MQEKSDLLPFLDMHLLSIAFSLFLLMDPIGNIPLYISFLKDIPPKKQRAIIAREMTIALFIIILFASLGDDLMRFLHVRNDTVQIAGGIILFLLCLKMIFPPSHQEDNKSFPKMEPFIVPLAIPLIAGPGVLAAVIIYAGQESNDWILAAAIFIAWFFSLLILLTSSFLQRILGNRGIIAMERLMGLIMILISVQMFLEGIASFTKRILT